MLHQNELVLSEKETNKFGDLISTFSNMQDIFKKAGQTIQTINETVFNNKLEVNIENVGGTEEDARNLSDILNNEWTRQMRTQRGVR